MITLQTPLPGPRARDAIARDQAVVSQSYTRDAHAPVVASAGNGVWVFDVDGNRLLDFTSGIATCSTGHCHPAVVKAITEQAQQLIHMSGTDFYYLPQITLAERMAGLVPGSGDKRVFFANSGAEAIEAAIKLTRLKTGRQHLIAFQGAFHGRTMGALSLSASRAVHRRGFGPFLPGVMHAPYPYCYRCPVGKQQASCAIECIEYLTETILQATGAGERRGGHLH